MKKRIPQTMFHSNWDNFRAEGVTVGKFEMVVKLRVPLRSMNSTQNGKKIQL